MRHTVNSTMDIQARGNVIMTSVTMRSLREDAMPGVLTIGEAVSIQDTQPTSTLLKVMKASSFIERVKDEALYHVDDTWGLGSKWQGAHARFCIMLGNKANDPKSQSLRAEARRGLIELDGRYKNIPAEGLIGYPELIYIGLVQLYIDPRLAMLVVGDHADFKISGTKRRKRAA